MHILSRDKYTPEKAIMLIRQCQLQQRDCGGEQDTSISFLTLVVIIFHFNVLTLSGLYSIFLEEHFYIGL